MTARTGSAPPGPAPVAATGILAATLVGAAALVELMAGGFGGPATAPFLVTAVVGFVVPAALLRLVRRRTGAVLAAPLGAIAVLAVAGGWAAAANDPHGSLQVSWAIPVPAVAGAILLGSVVTGAAGVAGRTILDSRRAGRTATALLPSLALVVGASAARPGFWCAAVAAAYVLAAAVALVDRRRVIGTLAIGALAAAMAVAVGLPLLANHNAVAGSTGGGSSPAGASAAMSVSGLVLATDLVGVEQRDATTVLFSGESPLPTYWQVASLTTWDGTAWQADAATRAALAGSSQPDIDPLTTTVPAGAGRPYRATVQLAALRTHLLPAPTTTTAVLSATTGQTATEPSPAVIPGIGVVDQGRATDYAVEAATVSATALPAGTGAARPAQLAPYLSLPPISSEVSGLARSVTAAAATPLGQAEALVDWFRSGPFRYTLTPPAAPGGTDPLVYFLTVSRSGSCQSFAGAFAVMARSLGLPTRVAVGFTAGRPTESGRTVVTGADAHAWPQVYLGGVWVSFEPTPAVPGGSVAPDGVIGPTGVSTTVPPTGPSTSAVPSTVPTTVPPGTISPTTASPGSVTPVSRPAGGPSVVTVAVLAVVLAVAGAVGVLAWRRRRRRRQPPAVRVQAAYRRAERSLRRARLGRAPGCSPSAHARQLLAGALVVTRPPGPAGPPTQPPTSRPPVSPRLGNDLVAALGGLRSLAVLVERSAYDPRPLSPDEAAMAERAARRLARVLRRPAVRYLVRSEGWRSAPAAVAFSGR